MLIKWGNRGKEFKELNKGNSPFLSSGSEKLLVWRILLWLHPLWKNRRARRGDRNSWCGARPSVRTCNREPTAGQCHLGMPALPHSLLQAPGWCGTHGKKWQDLLSVLRTVTHPNTLSTVAIPVVFKKKKKKKKGKKKRERQNISRPGGRAPRNLPLLSSTVKWSMIPLSWAILKKSPSSVSSQNGLLYF